MADDDKKTGVFSLIGGAFRFLFTLLRTLVYLIILVLFIGIVAAISGDGGAPSVPESAVLVVNPTAVVEEYPSFGDFENALIQAFDIETPTRVRDLVRALEAAQDDDRIKAVHLDLSNLTEMRSVHVDEIGKALEALSDAGKPVFGSSMFMTQFRYGLLSYGDEVYLNTFGSLDLIGPIAQRTYMSEGLDKLKIERFVYGSGPYKSAGESFVRNDMSDAEREQTTRLLEQRWQEAKERILRNRELDSKELNDYIENLPELWAAADGDAAAVAADSGLVDGTRSRLALEDRIEEATGITAGEDRISFKHYLRTVAPKFDTAEKRIAVVYGMGPILDGKAQFGYIGGESLARTIRNLRNKDNVAAIVFRVDSPGGSASASEDIREQLELAQLDGKIVVASMGDVAASGGYWVSATADEIWAHPQTITGSIGAVGVNTSLDASFEALGIHDDQVTVTKVAEDLVAPPGIGELQRRLMTIFIRGIYQDFLELVSMGRTKTLEEVHEIAQGRVWSGVDAKDLGLVDHLGGLRDAVASAAKLAELDDYRVTYHQQKQEMNLSLSAISLMLASENSTLSSLLGWLGDLLGEPSMRSEAPWRSQQVYCTACESASTAYWP